MATLQEKAVQIAGTLWRDHGIKITVKDQKRGWARHKSRSISIPARVFVLAERHRGFDIYYIAHEMAHILAGKDAAHGEVFMAAFKKLCPEEFWHYELEYKPRNAATAGIKRRPDLYPK